MAKAPRQPDPAALLEARPTPNQAVRTERQGKSLVLFVPNKPRWFMKPPMSLILPVRRERGLALDKLGEEVWRACDGRRTVEQIAETLARRHHLRFHEARLSVMQFLRELTRRGAIVLVVPRKAGEEASAA